MSKPSQTEPAEFVSFGDVARGRLRQQCQYASRYIDGRHGYPNLGEGLRFQGEVSDYHTLLIHRNDVEPFIKRVEQWKAASAWE